MYLRRMIPKARSWKRCELGVPWFVSATGRLMAIRNWCAWRRRMDCSRRRGLGWQDTWRRSVADAGSRGCWGYLFLDGGGEKLQQRENLRTQGARRGRGGCREKAKALPQRTQRTQRTPRPPRPPRGAGKSESAEGGRGLAEIVERHAQAGFKVNLGLPSQQGFGPGDIGTALLGIILRQWFVTDGAFGSGHGEHAPGAFENGEFGWVADVHGKMLVRV